MEKLTLLLLILISLLAAETHSLREPKRKVTKLRFYLHDVIGGDNPTVWGVAKCNLSDILPSKFGKVSVLDNLVTWHPDVNSRPLGRLQGAVGQSDLREKALVMLLNLVFTGGDYAGSTLSILGRNPLGQEVREVPVVGGTGAFRMATGYVITTTYFYDPDRVHSIYEYNVVVFHMDPADLLLSPP